MRGQGLESLNPDLTKPELKRIPPVRQSRPARHSRESGNPVDNKIPYKELIYRLDSRFRGNDEQIGGVRVRNSSEFLL